MIDLNNFSRYIEPKLKQAMQDTPVIFIMGARQSGKTTLVKSLTRHDWQFINLDDKLTQVIAQTDPVGFISNLHSPHIIIDEIQRVPDLLLAIKQSVDNNRKPGRFILTGSANALVLPQVADSLAGRIETILLNPLSECEINATFASFLSQLLAGQMPASHQTIPREHLLERIVKGAFPEPLQRAGIPRAQAWYKQYINALVQKDIKELSHIEHPDKMLLLLKSMALYSGQLVNLTELSGTINLNKETIKKYINLLEQLFLIKQLPAWHSNHYKRLVKTPKLHMIDTGLICALRGFNMDYLTNNLHEFGHLVETFVINELQKQAGFLEETDLLFYHYRDKDKVEVDCVIENAQGQCFGVEVKASATLRSQDFKGLKRFVAVAGERFKLGVLFYQGEQTLPIGDKLWAVPLAALWGAPVDKVK